jgi:hypothetical protein
MSELMRLTRMSVQDEAEIRRRSYLMTEVFNSEVVLTSIISASESADNEGVIIFKI